ncbi:aminopeptidase [Undibacterium arcticum]|uniref:Aminopeptidase n=1 Tax=Undibacterium arcticum TaxID=1762892 RepID=A0ABV7F298_9BURK
MKHAIRIRNGVAASVLTVLLGGATALVAGCSGLGYYAQAAQGQMSLLSEARPIDDWLADASVDAKLKTRLAHVKEIRQYAARELGLPDNGSYKNYADLKRQFVLWNVVATPPLSLRPTQWCFPVAGCVSYRGYYSKDQAQAAATALRDAGEDVELAGVPAYSTLGWFNDPVMSTFIQYPDAELARLIFHELAHQVVYAKGDSQFNESFATAVEEVGVERWLEAHGDAKMRTAYAEHEARKSDFLALLQKARAAALINYASDASDQQKLEQKKRIFATLQDDYQLQKQKWGGYAGYDRWFSQPLNNAHLAAVATYHDFVPGFKALLNQQKKNFGKFYAAVKQLAELDKSTRQQRLIQLGQSAPMMAGVTTNKAALTAQP